MTDLFEGKPDDQEAAPPAAAAPRTRKRKSESKAAVAAEMAEKYPDGMPPPPPVAVEESVGALVAQTTANPVAVFTDEAKFSEFYAKLKTETAKHVPDVATRKGREAIASLAFRVTKAKTTLDKAGLGLTEDWRTKIALVNASRSKMKAELQGLADEVRAPLTAWEVAEAKRVATNEAILARMRADAVIHDDDTSATVEARGRSLYALTFTHPEWTEDEAATAIAERDQIVTALLHARNRLAREELDRAELDKLRAEKAERDERDRIAAEEAEAERQRLAQIEADRLAEVAAQEAAAAAAKRAEEDAQAAREAEAKRIEEARAAAAAEAAAAAQRAAEEAQAERQREHDKAIAEANAAAEEQRRADQARIDEANERAAQVAREAQEAQAKRDAEIAEAARLAQIEADEREAKRLADQQRAEDLEHKGNVMRAAKEAIMEHGGVDEPTARKIVLALVAGTIPNTSVKF